MGRPVRLVESDKYYFITNRCMLGLFLMRPDEETRRIIKGCLARAADKHDVDLVCFVFMSNHFHLIARFPDLNMAEFMGELQSQIVSRLNDHRGRSGVAFPERYDAQTLLDDQAVRDKVCYTLNNPVRAGLVEQASDWPGVSSMASHLTGNPLVGRWLNGKKRRKHRRRKADYDRSEAMEEYTVDLHIPEAFDGETEAERRRHLLDCIASDRRRAWAVMTDTPGEPPKVLGEEQIKKQPWTKCSQATSHRRFQRRRLAMASDIDALRSYREKRWETTEKYRRASARFRDNKPARFPHGTYPIGHKRCVDLRETVGDAA